LDRIRANIPGGEAGYRTKTLRNGRMAIMGCPWVYLMKRPGQIHWNRTIGIFSTFTLLIRSRIFITINCIKMWLRIATVQVEYFYALMSPSSKGSPHSGQNLGGFAGSSGSHPHLSHLYSGTPAGFGLPHSEQNFPLLTAPQAQIQPSAAGFGAPHSVQNFPVFPAFPQVQAQPVGSEPWGFWFGWAVYAPSWCGCSV
jgi:hypothetical protein